MGRRGSLFLNTVGALARNYATRDSIRDRFHFLKIISAQVVGNYFVPGVVQCGRGGCF